MSGIKYPASSYTIWFVSAVWRRKTSLLAVIVLTILLVICLEYNVTKEIVEITLSRQEPETEDVAGKAAALQQKSRVRNVQFVGDDVLTSRENLVDVVGHSNDVDYVRVMDGDFQRRKSIEPGYKRSPEVSSGESGSRG